VCRVVEDRRNAALQAAVEQTEYRGTQRLCCHLAEHPRCGLVSFQCWSSPRSALCTNRVGNNYLVIVRVTRRNYAISVNTIPAVAAAPSSQYHRYRGYTLPWLRLSIATPTALQQQLSRRQFAGDVFTYCLVQEVNHQVS